MSADQTYFNVPLALLRAGESPLRALQCCLSCGIVNAGIGYQRTHGEGIFQKRLGEAMEAEGIEDLEAGCPRDATHTSWEAALVGAPIVGVQGGDRGQDAIVYTQHHQAGAVFFRIRSDWMWNALHTAQEEAGEEEEGAEDFKPLTWREFRLLAAILSARANRHGFVFLGWQSIQARACGYHSKALFQAGRATLPAHCQPLSRRQIRQGLDRLETLGFFARCRYARGARGGLMAYSFRHPQRQGLVQDILKWAATRQSFKARVDALRAEDRAAFATPQAVPRARPAPAPHPVPPRPAPPLASTATPLCHTPAQPQPPPYRYSSSPAADPTTPGLTGPPPCRYP